MEKFLAACASVSTATSPTSRASAEAYLLSLRLPGNDLTDNIALCQAIVDSPQTPIHAKLLALLTLREMQTMLPPNIQGWILHGPHWQQHHHNHHQLEPSLFALLAKTWKKQYLIMANSAHQINTSISSLSPTMTAGLILAVIQEFQTPSSPLTHHQSCAKLFQQHNLKPLFILALDHLTTLVTTPSLQHVDNYIAAHAESLDAILAWSFHSPGSPRASDLDSFQNNVYLRTSPGPDWTDVLVTSHLIRHIAQLYKRTSPHAELTRHRLRQVLCSLANLSGDVFPTREAASPHMQDALEIGYEYVAQTLNGGEMLWQEPNESPLASQAFDACIIITRALYGAPGDVVAIRVLDFSNLTLHFLTLQHQHPQTEWIGAILERTLDIWVHWLQANNIVIPPHCLRLIFDTYLAQQMTNSTNNNDANDDDDNDTNEPSLEIMALLGRADFHTTLSHLFSHIHTHMQTPEITQTIIENLITLHCLLVRVMADPHGAGETPCKVISPPSQAHQAVLAILTYMFSHLALTNSPWVWEQLLINTQRWAHTWLPGDDDQTITMLIKMASTLLAHMGQSEPAVAHEALQLLLFIGNMDGAPPTDAFQELQESHFQSVSQKRGWAPLANLESHTHGMLLRVVACRSAVLQHPEVLDRLCTSLASRLLSSSSSSNATELDLFRLVSLFRGLVVVASTYNQVRDFIISTMPMWCIPRALRSTDVVLPELLSFLLDFCDLHLLMLDVSRSRVVEQLARTVVQAYTINASVSSWSDVVESERDEQRADVVLMALKIGVAFLDHQSVLDFSAPTTTTDNVAAPPDGMLVIETLLPLLSKRRLFNFSNVADVWFEVIAGICRLPVHDLIRISNDLLRVVVESFQGGIEFQSPLVQRRALEALGTLVTHVVVASTVKRDGHGTVMATRLLGMFPTFLRDSIVLVLKTVCSARCEEAVVDAASNTLYTLVACDGGGAYSEAVRIVLNDLPMNDARGRMMEVAFQEVVQGVKFVVLGEGGAIRNVERKAFRKHVGESLERILVA